MANILSVDANETWVNLAKNAAAICQSIGIKDIYVPY